MLLPGKELDIENGPQTTETISQADGPHADARKPTRTNHPQEKPYSCRWATYRRKLTSYNELVATRKRLRDGCLPAANMKPIASKPIIHVEPRRIDSPHVGRVGFIQTACSQESGGPEQTSCSQKTGGSLQTRCSHDKTCLQQTAHAQYQNRSMPPSYSPKKPGNMALPMPSGQPPTPETENTYGHAITPTIPGCKIQHVCQNYSMTPAQQQNDDYHVARGP